MASTPSVKHPHITQHKDRCGGQPVIKGTKFPVRSVVAYVLQQGMTPEADNLGQTDEVQLAFSTQHQRALLTHNIGDFV